MKQQCASCKLMEYIYQDTELCSSCFYMIYHICNGKMHSDLDKNKEDVKPQFKFGKPLC